MAVQRKHITLQHITAQHITSHHITPHHITPHHSTLHHTRHHSTSQHSTAHQNTPLKKTQTNPLAPLDCQSAHTTRAARPDHARALTEAEIIPVLLANELDQVHSMSKAILALVHTYIHTHTHRYIHTYTHRYIHTHTDTYRHTQTRTYTHEHTYTHDIWYRTHTMHTKHITPIQ